jgi:UDPglucose 6-dehydrogenase
VAYGGPCFPRDSEAFSMMADGFGVEAHLAVAAHRVNLEQSERLADTVMSHLPRGGTAAILGLAYKPGTEVVEASPGIALVEALLARNARVTVADPAALVAARDRLGDRVSWAESADAAVTEADVVVIVTAWPEYGELSEAALAAGSGRKVLIDGWRQYIDDPPESVDYVPLGSYRSAP